MVETRSGKMQDPAQERIQAEESAKPQPGATIGRDASSDPVVLNPNIDIPKYDGTEDPRPWIESLEEIGFLYHWADYIISRYAAMNMTGSAKTWLNLHKASFTSWENIKIRLIQDFSLDANKEELRMKLNRMQHWNEPAIRFAEDILVLCNKVDPAMEEETKIEHVIGGLKKEYSFALYLNPPKTTDDLLVVCKKMDSFEKKYRERVEKSRNLYNGPRYSRPQQQSRYVPPTAARNYQTTSRPQAPVSNNYKNDSPPTPRQYRNNFPQPSTPRRPYNPNFVPKPNLQRNTYNKIQEVSKNRTEDGRPICFKCNKPGHVARYCRVKFIRILEEDPADTQEKVEEKCQMNEISEKSGPRLYADIGTFEALVDTGADLSVVDLRTALDTGHGISKLAKICAGPDGKKLDMVGSIFLNIKIDDETLSHNFVILKTHLRTLILGRDFLKKMNAKIDCKQETIKYDLTNNHDEINFEMLKIKSAKDSIVPECSMKLIKALVETEDGEYIIEESSKMFQTNGLRLARSLINVINRETHIWITNPYPRPLKIMKNQTLAFGSSPAKINVSREREVEKNEEPRFQINENLPPKEQKELKQVLERYGDLFSSRLGRTNLAKHRIDTEDAKPIKHKPYRVSAKERDIIKEQIDEMLTEGIIRPSSSPWSFPVILVKKRDGKYRFCVDYRKLNNVTVKDVYPIPRIDEVMDTLQGSTHFSAIDLRSGYWQVEVEERDKEKTAFTTAHGLYEFNVMPFGLCNAPATFERNMENMLGNLRWQICLCYLDDVIIYSPDFPTHLKRLEAVFRCFRESNLRLNDKKCRFAFEELEILGYITGKHGIKPAEHNIKAVRNFPRPKKVKEVQSFLGMCSYYRKFIKDFSKIADPLTNLIKKSVSFTWTERQEEAFQTLKTALLSPPILGHFNPNAPTYVHTDASNIGIGATLVQDIGGEEKVISYLSRTLSKAEQNYSTTEKECLAVVWSMSKLRPYLYGRHFKIVTDHHALCWLKNLKDPTGRLARWALKIQEYDFDIIHKSGKKHLDADGLSRGPLPETDWDEDFERLFLNQITDEEDKFIESVKKNLNGSRRSIAQNFKVEDGCLFKKNPNPEGRAWLLVVPEKKKREIMKEYHNHMSNGHLGVARTMYRIKSKYFWPSMLKDVSEFVKTCHLCQSRKGSNQLPSGLLQPIPPANFPFERIGIDFVETKAVSEATVKEVSKFLVEDIFLRHGAPQYLISDRGSQFASNLMKEVMKTCKIKHCFTTSYHPQTNGLTERLNRTLINMLSMYVNTDQKNWDEILPFITHAYNTTIQETTGYSPFFLMFGREPTSLLDDRNISVDIDKDDYDEYIKHHLDKINRTRKLVINNTIKTQERMKKNYDKRHMEKSYEPGELVAVWTPIRKIGKCEKLLRKYFGPYRILKKLSNVNYLIEPKDNPGQDPLIVHVSRIKPYFERIDEVNHEDVTTSGEGEVCMETSEALHWTRQQQQHFSPSDLAHISRDVGQHEEPGTIVYKVDDIPPWPLAILLGLQHYLTMFGGVITYPYLLAPSLCIPPGHPAQGHLVSTTFFVSGLSTAVQTSFGVRLPIVQGNSLAFLGPSLAVLAERGPCPTGPQLVASRGDNSTHPATPAEWDSVWMDRMQELRGGLQASCCLKRSDCCLPPTPVYFLEYSRRFYGLLSPVLLLLSLTVLQLALQAQNQETREALNQAFQAQNQETREALNEALQAQNQELKESLGLKFQCLEDEISAVREDVSSIKEDVSSVKEEVKEKISALEERLAAVEMGHPRTPVFQQENNNSGRPLVKVPTFDGQSSWTSFKTQLDVVAQANGWNVRDKASFLAAALRGPAVDVLQMIPEQLRLDFNSLIDALESRYGEEHYQQLHVVKFKNRLQEKKESLQDLAHDIRRLARLAFPTCPSETQDFMAQHQFIDAIGDPETQRFVRLSSATTLQETLVQAMKYEAAQQATIESYRVARQVKLYNPETEENRFWTRRAHDHMSPTCRRKVKQRSDTGCWKCGKNGHIRKHCPDNSKDKPERKRGHCWTCGALDHISLTCPRKVKQRSDTDCWSCGQYGHVRRNCPENSETTTAPRRNHGRRNDNADALSRRPCVPQSGHCARAEERFCLRQVTLQESDEVEEKNWTGQALRKAQREDRDLLPMMNWKESGERPSWEDVASHSPKTKSLWRLWNSLTLRDGVLYRKWESEDGKHESWKLVLPSSLVPLALQEMHSSPTGDHFGIRKTLVKVRERFCWPGSRNDVEKWCRNCTKCSVRKGTTTRSRGKFKIYNVGAPFERMPAIHQCAGENLHFSSEKMKYRYYVKTSNKTFKEGEMVWLHNPQRKRGLSPKLQYQWEGPYKIIKCLNDVIFRIKKTPTSKPKVVHYNRLAPIRGTVPVQWTVRDDQTKLRGGLQASCCLKRSDCCLPPTPVYFLEYSRRFYGLLSPVLLLLSLTVLQLLQAGMLAAALVEVAVGATGLAGVLSRGLTPLVVAPTVALVGLPLFGVVADSAALNWPVSASTILLLLLFSQYLSNVQVPFPVCHPKKKFRIGQLPLFKIFPVVLTIFVVWGVCAILTLTNTLAADDCARTDLKLDALYQSPWFRIPYPFQWGWPTTLRPGVVAAMTAGILASMVESVGDYHSCARLCGLPPPPGHAISRGLLAEGLGCLLSGAWGTGSGTTSFSENIAAIGITKVASRRVVLVGAAIMMVCGCVGKFGALFVTLPSPLVAGVLVVGFSIITAVGLSQLHSVDLSSPRNLCVLGLALFLGLAVPHWTAENPAAIATGNSSADQIIRVLLTTNMLVGGFLGLVMDHTMPGTDRERGIVSGPPPGSRPAPAYDLPVGMEVLRRHRVFRYVPFLPTFRQKLSQ
ncbi:hypothetical protein LAZ67_16000346 [Cordylochernes scorpioides]|uniref:RNA-directed DNA polymerase n=1 Tax=Cordylochernes scorpioides TaxID=51811 RepID=A0ABY6LAI1_9ARAC|nr:hypothetical protein LAZ67_16000346 [Cordylochernes scorpioides]